MPALIEARDLTKKYGAHIALNRVNFSVQAGRIVGLIGPNGAGKTSALRAILGLTAYQGHLQVLGREPFRERTELMHDACFIADVAVLPAWLRVDQAIDFVAGVHPRFRRDRAMALLSKTQITGKRRMRELSKGMKTQVHLALTMAIDAKLLVLDEPTAGVDIEIRRSMWEFLNDINASGTTIILTTHYLEEAESLCRNIAIIDNGHIVERDRMSNLLRGLRTETFVLNLRNPVQAAPSIAGYALTLLDDHTIEAELSKDQSLNGLFSQLAALGLDVLSMRNKVNRLEEVFMRLVEHRGTNG